MIERKRPRRWHRLKCLNCERCTWNPGPDCRLQEHAHCERCLHCIGRHDPRGGTVLPPPQWGLNRLS